MARIIAAFICASLLIAQMQTGVMAAHSTCYEIEQIHRSYGLMQIYFDSNSLRIDWHGAHLSIFSKAPDWRVNVINYATKKQASATFSDWCRSGFGTYLPWVEPKNLAGHYQKKIPIVFDGFKAYKLVCAETREMVDDRKDGISWSTKRKNVPITMRYAFLDGIKIDSHIPRIVEAIYCVGWENRLILAIKGQYDGGVERPTLNTNSIKAVPSQKVRFEPPSDFQTVAMGQISQGKLDFFK